EEHGDNDTQTQMTYGDHRDELPSDAQCRTYNTTRSTVPRRAITRGSAARRASLDERVRTAADSAQRWHRRARAFRAPAPGAARAGGGWQDLKGRRRPREGGPQRGRSEWPAPARTRPARRSARPPLRGPARDCRARSPHRGGPVRAGARAIRLPVRAIAVP